MNAPLRKLRPVPVAEEPSPSVGLEALRVELAGSRCRWKGCGESASALVESGRSYCLEHARAAETYFGRRVLVWPLCAVDGCRELGWVRGVVRRSALRSEVALVCGRHAGGRVASGL